jgi:GGDEF domain-containing protein
LVYSTVVAAALIAGGSLAVVVTGGVTVDPLRLAVATVVLAVSLLARVPVGSGRDLPRLTWAPLGVMVACVLVPLVSVCLVAVAAAVVAHAPALVGHGPLERVRARYEVSAVAAAAGIAVAAVIGLSTDPTRPVPARADQPNALTMLLLVGLISFLVATALAVGWVVTGRARPALPIWRTSTAVGGPLVLGCLFIGVAGVVVVPVSPWWLAVLVPIFWLLHRTFIARTRLNEDHRIWAELADATRALHELDDRGVRSAALRGAARLFAPDQVELVLLTEARRPGDSGAEQVREIVMRSPPGPAIGATIKGRRLVVGGHEIGQLRLRFRRRVMLSAAEHDAFLTFADAVASALHDASTHRRLRAMTARSAYEAVHDPLTGLSNRFTVLARGNAELASLDPAQAVALILFNIDKFHEINDAMSHTAGDEVLRQLARRLVDSQRDGELLGYLGGDEFALLTADVGADHAVAASSTWRRPSRQGWPRRSPSPV